MRFPRLLDDLVRDLRYGLRVLTRSPLFSLVAIASLAIGIGGAASVFTVMNAVLLRNLPVPNPQQLLSAEKVGTSDRSPRFAWPQFEDARRELQGRAELAAFIYPTSMNVRIGSGSASGPSERALVQLVSGEFFTVLRQQPQAGRLLSTADNQTLDAHPSAVISDGYWRRQFRGAPDAIGRTLVINGTTFTVIGVAQPEFYGAIVAPRNPEIWVPLMMQSAVRYASNASNSGGDPLKPWPPQREIEWLNVMARVPDRSNIAPAAAALTVLFQRDLRNSSDSADADALRRISSRRVELQPAQRGLSGFRNDLNTPLIVLLAMVGVLLAIACGNVASLLISRANARDREIAIRLSIGAGRSRVIRQLLAETMLMAIVGGSLGLLAAAWGRDLLLSMFARGSTAIDMDTSFDWRVLSFAFGVTALTGLLAGVGPALRGTRVALADSLKSQGRSAVADGGRRGALIGKTLVAAQIAFCLLLLVLGALFTRSMQSLLRIDVGYDRARILVARMDVRSLGYAPAERQALYARILGKLSSLPGVESASISLNGPLGTSQRTSSFAVEGYTPGPDEQLVTNEEIVTDHYFETVGLRIVDGRGFQPEDRTPGAGATIINQSMAKRFFPNGSAIGKRWNSGADFNDRGLRHRRGRRGRKVRQRACRVPEDDLPSDAVHTERCAGEHGGPRDGAAGAAHCHGAEGARRYRAGAPGIRRGAARRAPGARAGERHDDRESDVGFCRRGAAARMPGPVRHDFIRRHPSRDGAGRPHGARRSPAGRPVARHARGGSAGRRRGGDRSASGLCRRAWRRVDALRGAAG